MNTICKMIILILLLQISFKGISQNFISEDKMWSIVIVGGFDDYIYYSTDHYKFSGDTILNGIVSKKMYVSHDENHQYWRYHSVWNERNDSVFYNNRWLIYDFNVQEKDTFKYSGEDYPEDIIVFDSIRTKFFAGKIRKHYYSHFPRLEEFGITVWIEGIGFPNNPTRNNDYFWSGTSQSLLCFEEEGNLVYQDTEYNTCYVNTTSAPVTPKKEEFVSLYAMGEGAIRVELFQGDTGTLHLLTPDGKQILKCPLTAPETTLCAPGKGLFLYRFVSEKGEVQSGKVVVK
ncbi:MAG: hypothetical protein JW798_17580 [Prolixibacteraceae bacterium]|nr:hypothetical protein [Prolixibacteraceae bacterium]